MKITLNEKDGLYVLDHGKYVTCLGFNVAFQLTERLAKEMNRADLMPKIENKGKLAGYEDYEKCLEVASKSGKRFECELSEQLKGLEGKRVEVVDSYGEKRRFKVGKSTGFIPCHLELANSRSSGGISVYGTPFKSVRVIK